MSSGSTVLPHSSSKGDAERERTPLAIQEGVPQEIVGTQMLYFDALKADALQDEPGATEESCRNIFATHFAAPTTHLASHIDDMLWFVRTPHRARDADAMVFLQRRGPDTDALLQQAEEVAGPASDSSFSERVSQALPKLGSRSPGGESIGIGSPRRREGSEGVQSGSGIRWRETLALNIAVQWTFTLSVSVVRKLKVNGTRRPVVVRQVKRRVYATPTRARFEEKEQRSGDTIDYPNLYFNIDDFEECFGGIQLCEGYCLTVLLTAGESNCTEATIFRGLLPYETIMERVQKRTLAKKKLPTADCKEFVPLLGPERMGKAEIAVCISDAELLTFANPSSSSASFDKSPGGVDHSPSGGGNSTGAGGGARFFKRLFSPKEAPKLTGNETIQCFLTYVSVNVNHVTSLLCCSQSPSRTCWLYEPKTRKELDQILAHDDNQYDDDQQQQQQHQRGQQQGRGGGGAAPSPVSECSSAGIAHAASCSSAGSDAEEGGGGGEGVSTPTATPGGGTTGTTTTGTPATADANGSSTAGGGTGSASSPFRLFQAVKNKLAVKKNSE